MTSPQNKNNPSEPTVHFKFNSIDNMYIKNKKEQSSYEGVFFFLLLLYTNKK
jgi:hypothetical protein